MLAALLSALLFGVGTPLAKLLLDDVGPWLLAGLLYLGAGSGLLLYRLLRCAPSACAARSEVPWLSRLALAGILIGLIAGAISYTIERRHIETSDFAKVLESAQRFNTKEYRLHFIRAYEGNSLGLKRLLDDSPFLAMRVLNSSGRSQAETWKSASAGLRLFMEEHAYSPDNDGSNHLDWLQIGDDQFIRVVIPLAEA